MATETRSSLVSTHRYATYKARWVNYIGLDDHPYHEVATRQFRKGAYGGVLSFGVKGKSEVGSKVVDSLKLASNLANVGDAKTVSSETWISLIG